MNQSVLIIGATSGIAEAVARRFAERGARLYLVARSSNKLEVISTDLTARGAPDVQTFVMDANDSDLIPRMVEAAWNAYGSFDIALVAHGTLPDQHRTEIDIPYAIDEFRTNAESVIACLTGLARRFESQRYGAIAVIGSVAGDRGRASNYLYGAAKSAIETYASGLRVKLFRSGVHVLTIKPGFVATSMTRGLPLPAALVVSADKVASDIIHALEKKRAILYTPWFWRFIMLVIMLIPNILFKRMKL